MLILETITTAQNNLFRNKVRIALTMLAIFVGATTLFLTNGIASGIESYINSQFSDLEEGDTTLLISKEWSIGIGGGGGPTSNLQEYDPNVESIDGFEFTYLDQEDYDYIASFDLIENIIPQYVVQALYIQLQGENPYGPNLENRKYEAEIGQFFEESGLEISAGEGIDENSSEFTAVLPSRYYKGLGFEEAEEVIGRTITVAFENGFGQIQEFDVKIVGTMIDQLREGNPLRLSINLLEAALRFQNPNQEIVYFGFYASLDPDTSPEEVKELQAILEGERYEAPTIREFQESFLDIIGVIRWVLNAVGIILLFVASFGIINTLLMSVYERTREIGLMRAVGMSRANVFLLFTAEAVLIGFWASVLGLIAGLGIGTLLNIYTSNTILEGLPGFSLFVYPVLSSIFIVFVIMAISFIASIIPAIKASRLNPIDALRQE